MSKPRKSLYCLARRPTCRSEETDLLLTKLQELSPIDESDDDIDAEIHPSDYYMLGEERIRVFPCLDEYHRRLPCDPVACARMTNRPWCGWETRHRKLETIREEAMAREGCRCRTCIHLIPFSDARDRGLCRMRGCAVDGAERCGYWRRDRSVFRGARHAG